MSKMRQRSGFTLIEMLIATGIFVVGFVSVYSMFLAGSKFRRKADSLTQTALATTSLIETLRLRAGTEAGGPYAPSTYNGDGDPTTDDGSGSQESGFVPFADQPTIWYRFAHAADLTGGDDAGALGFRVVLQVIDLGSTPTNADGDYELSVDDIGQRLRVSQDMDTIYVPAFTPDEKLAFEALNGDTDAEVIFVLRMRGLLNEQEAFINRRSL